MKEMNPSSRGKSGRKQHAMSGDVMTPGVKRLENTVLPPASLQGEGELGASGQPQVQDQETEEELCTARHTYLDRLGEKVTGSLRKTVCEARLAP